MKQTSTYKDLTLAGLKAKQKEFTKDLLTSRLTMDVTAVSSASNLQNVLRELKIVNRLIAKSGSHDNTTVVHTKQDKA